MVCLSGSTQDSSWPEMSQIVWFGPTKENDLDEKERNKALKSGGLYP